MSATQTTTASRFERLASWSQRHHWRALVIWIVVAAGITVTSMAVGSDYHNDFSLPGTESQDATDTLAAHGSVQSNDTIDIVVHDADGVAAPQTKQRVDAMLAEVRELPHVADIRSPYAEGTVSKDGETAFATLTLDGLATDVPTDDVRTIIDTAQAAAGNGLQVELGGDAARSAQESEGGAAEGAGMIAALVILVLLFGSLLAASLPLITALIAVGSTLGVIVLVSHLTDMPDFAPPLMMLVGLGVGIDYALLIFSRFRGELLAGAPRDRAISKAIDTAGRTVLFAGCTVILALLGLAALGLGSLQGVALAVSLTVLVTMLASITLLPSLLIVFGKRIERAIAKRAARSKHDDGALWRRWAGVVQRRPWPTLVVSVAALGALALPALGIHLGFADAGNDAESKTSRKAYDLVAEGFGAGFNGPLIVVADGGQGAGEAAEAALRTTDGIATVTPPQPSEDGEVSTLLAFPTTSPQDQATNDLLEQLRNDVLPPIAAETDSRLLVGGATAAADDFATSVTQRMPYFLAIVVGLSTLLLMLLFRSILIPIKAALLNMLSIGASLGVIKLIFQDGNFGVAAGPIEAFVPVMIFAIVFGLSMDYEVFLVSRMHEEWERTRDAEHAVRQGLGTTGRVITAAAGIMIVVFGAFVLSPDRMLQQFGLGLAVAIFVDAVIIRCLIVPAVMQLFGEKAWWLPRRLQRVPRIALEHQ